MGTVPEELLFAAVLVPCSPAFQKMLRERRCYFLDSGWFYSLNTPCNFRKIASRQKIAGEKTHI